jgi:hypothetical protein
MAKVRLHLEISQELADLLNNVAKSESVTRSEIVRSAISLFGACREQRAMGRIHLGFVQDASRLDAEISGIFRSARGQGSAAVSPTEDDTGDAALSQTEPQPIVLDAVMSRWSPHLSIL